MRNWRDERGLGEARTEPPGASAAAVQRLRLGIVLLAGLLLAAGSVQARRALAQSDCRSVAIRSPFSGDVLSGTITILGSARIDAFQFYKLEWAPEDEPESWRAVSSTIDQPVSNGRLDVWDTQALPDGRYRLKLTAVDQQSGERCRALVAPLWLANSATPEATEAATPLPSVTAIPRQRPAGTSEPDTVPPTEEPNAGQDLSVTQASDSNDDSAPAEPANSAEESTADSQRDDQDEADARADPSAQIDPNKAAEPVASPGPVVAGGEALAEAGGNLLVSASMGFAAVMLALLGLGLVWWVVGRRGR